MGKSGPIMQWRRTAGWAVRNRQREAGERLVRLTASISARPGKRGSLVGKARPTRRRPPSVLAPEQEITEPFVLLADCEVVYEGRASSTLRRGHYLLIRKADRSFL